MITSRLPLPWLARCVILTLQVHNAEVEAAIAKPFAAAKVKAFQRLCTVDEHLVFFAQAVYHA